MKYIKTMSLLMAALLTACSSSDGDTKEEPRPMIVDVVDTRTDAATTTSSLRSFSMNYLNTYKYDFSRADESTPWNTNTWPSGVGNDVKIDFYAYTGGTFYYNEGTPYVRYTVDNNAFVQHDLLTAEHKQISFNDAGGHVSLLFGHACTAVTFHVYITNTLRNSLGRDLTVNSIVLHNVNNMGNYNYGTNSWTDVSGTASYTLNGGNLDVTTESQQLPCKYLFMIPQNHAADGTTGTYLEINYTTSATKTAIIPLAIDWKIGETFNFDIKLGTITIQL